MGSAHRPTSELEAEELRRSQALFSAGSACRDLLSSSAFSGEAGTARSVGFVWHSVNGVLERRATTGVFVDEKPCRAGRDPLLVVYVDTRPHVVDFMANREVYLARLAHAGLRFSDIRFVLNRDPSRARGARDAAPARPPLAGTAARPLPPLPAEEAARIERMVQGLPQNLRASVSRAMSATRRSELGEEG